MKKNVINYTVFPLLIQAIQKIKLKHTFYINNKESLTFLNFLWENKIIYGYYFNKWTKLGTIFLKYSITGNNFKFKKYFKPCHLKKIKTEKEWSKNSFFIFKTKTGIFTIQQTLHQKVGGFLLYKIY